MKIKIGVIRRMTQEQSKVSYHITA
jgi:hypothetical protein